MTYNETGFRAVYRQFCAFMITNQIREAVRDYPGEDSANCVLGYGYIDREVGLTVEVLGCGQKKGDSFRFAGGRDDVRTMLRIGSIESDEFYIIDDSSHELAKRYSEKLDILKTYGAGEEVEKTRDMAFLDRVRDKYFPDDVLVYLTKDGLKPEGCWTRICGLGDHYFTGTLLNEPDQNFGWHQGEIIAFFLRQTEDQKVECYSDMNPSRRLTAKDMEDGTLLKEAIHAFTNERTEANAIEIMELLRDSWVWVPCNAILSDADYAAVEKKVKEAQAGDKGLDSLVGQDLTNQDPIRFVPDLLQNEDGYFFPVFTDEEAMGEYGENFSKIEKHFLETISLARNNKEDVKGIVINAFTEPFVLNRDLFDLVEKMKSRIVDESETENPIHEKHSS